MPHPTCAVGCLDGEGTWVGFAPEPDGGYALAVGSAAGSVRRVPAEADDLVSLAIAYFEDGLPLPPPDMAATHADIGSMMRFLVASVTDAQRRRALVEALDAVDDGLAADVVVGRLKACLAGGEDPVVRLARRAAG